MQPAKTARSFTLIELLIVVALISVALGFVVSEFSGSQAGAARNAAAIVSLQLEYVRELAIGNNSNYTVTFDTSNNQLVLTHSGSDNTLDTLPDTAFWVSNSAKTAQSLSLGGLPLNWKIRVIGATPVDDDTTELTSLEFLPNGGTTEENDAIVWLRIGTSQPTYAPITVLAGTGLTENGDLTRSYPSFYYEADDDSPYSQHAPSDTDAVGEIAAGLQPAEGVLWTQEDVG
jgi:prepilin-type N-terminal cleavage/methylation domain-containing protein